MSCKGFKWFGFHIDVGRQIERPEVLLRAVKGMGKCGYNYCMLYLEDAFLFERHPGIARQNAYTTDFMRQLQKVCAGEGLELIPVVNSLAHCAYITTKKGYEHYDEGRGTEHNYGTLSPSYPETYTLLRELYEDWCLNIPGSFIQVGLDEAAYMGAYQVRTQGPASFDRVGMFADHCNRLNAICKSLNRRMAIGGDMFYYIPQAIDLIDKDIIVLDWFYYRFKDATRVEAFNFSDIDLSGILKKKGIEVWGTAAVWPNSPLGDVEDRWQAWCDWIRYGRDKKIEGLVLCDWENSVGFYSNSDILIRAFGANACKAKRDSIERAVQDVLAGMLDIDPQNTDLASFVSDMMRLGEFSVTGHPDRRLYLKGLETLANPARQDECRRKFEACEKLFRSAGKLIKSGTSQQGRDAITALELGRRFVSLIWKCGTILTDCYAGLCRRDPAEDKKITKLFSDLAGEIGQFAADYDSHWNKVRFGNDRKVAINWARNALEKLRSWIDAISLPDRNLHPLLDTPRLECTLHCRHPALPVIMLKPVWEDGFEQLFNETMIRFDSKYAWPDVTWQQYPSIPLGRNSLPVRIIADSVNYGQVGLESISVLWRGKRYVYNRIQTSGKNVSIEGDIAWLGPKCQQQDSPLLRTEFDEAVYERN
jgi:hypothetical protein